ncbi:MAG: PilZ domain-containing protein [Candidatus Omnitrophota bacterium]
MKGATLDMDTEKRKQPRVRAHIPIRYRKLRDGAVIQGGCSLSKNLGHGGICFRTSEFISMACKIILELDIPRFEKPIKAIARVAWIKKAASKDEYEVGNQFIEMSKEDKEFISEYFKEYTHGRDAETS